MTFLPYSRFAFMLSGAAILISITACGGRPDTKTEMSRYGDDVVVSGSTPLVTDTVMGDAILAGGDLRLSGEVGGDYLGVGGTQIISGRIYGSTRAAGGEIHLGAIVDRNATIAGGDIDLDSSAVIGRNAYLAGGMIQVDGTVQGALQMTGGTVVLNGTVGGDVEIFARELVIGPTARIGGNLRYRVPAGNVQIDSATSIAGTVTGSEAPQWQGTWALLRLLWMVGFLVTGVVLIAMFPRFIAKSVEILHDRPGPSGLVGLGWILLAPIGILILAITVIGLPLALILTTTYIVLLYLGPIIPAVWLGQRILPARSTQTGRKRELLNFLVGVVLLLLIRMIPFIGTLVMGLATILGVGALLLRMSVMRNNARRRHSRTRSV